MLNLNTSTSMLNIHEAATVALADRVRQMRAVGQKVIGLQTGDPDFSTPDLIIEAMNRALRNGQTHYADSRGLPQLRATIVEKLKRVNKVNYDPQKEILVTCGGVHAYHCALRAIINPGDEILVPDPAWMTHTNMVALMGGRAVRISSKPENNFWPEPTAWEEACSPRTVAMVINSPNNPTGSVADEAYLNYILDFATRHNLWVISDEVYENILFDNKHHTSFAALSDAKVRTLLVNSLSKTYAMTGWRVGYLAAPAEVISQALKVSQYSITNVAPFIQAGAICALTSPEVQEAAKNMVTIYEQRRAMVIQNYQKFPRTPIRIYAPQGAFFFFFDCRSLNQSSVDISERLLEDVGVAVVPGAVYGNNGEGFLRITIAAANHDIDEGVSRILSWTSTHINSGKEE
jgi:aspartate/methionine/tyrosine aminotransferase